MQIRKRFIGISPFSENEADIFFSRTQELASLLENIENQRITIIHSNAGVGKTSLLKAALVPSIKNTDNNNCFFLTIDNFKNNDENFLINNFINQLNIFSPQFSYLDKLIDKENSLWYFFKRLEGESDKKSIIIFDQFENLFSYPENIRYNFKQQLSNLINLSFPDDYSKIIFEKLSEDPSLLTEMGKEKLFNKIKLNVIFSVRSDKLLLLNYFKDNIPKIIDNQFVINSFDELSAKEILVKTSRFVPKFSIDDNFVSKPFSISDGLLNEIIKFLTKSKTRNVESYQIQIIGSELEKTAIEKKLTLIDIADIKDVTTIYKDYYEKIIENISNSRQQISAKKFIEDELIFEYEQRKISIYEGMAKQKYQLDDFTIKYLIDNHLINSTLNQNSEVYFELNHDALIVPILEAKQKRIFNEIKLEEEVQQKRKIEEESRLQKIKTKKNRRYAIIFFTLFIVTFVLGIYAVFQKNKAIKSQKLAISTIYASYSFHNLELDPTLSLRLAQKSYLIDPENVISQSAVLKSFYKTNSFYNILSEIELSFDDGVISNDAKNVILISNISEKKTIYYIGIDGKIIFEEPQKDIITSANISNDNTKLYYGNIKGEITILNIKDRKKIEFKQAEMLFNVKMSNDNKLILSCGANGSLKLWNSNGDLLTDFKGHTQDVKYASFSNDGSKIVSAGTDNNVIVWDLSGKILSKYNYDLEYVFQNNEIQPVSFSDDDSKILIVINDYLHFNYQIKVWDWKNNQIIFKNNNFSSWIMTSKFIGNDKIISNCKNGTIIILDVKTNETRILIGHKNAALNSIYHSESNTIYSLSTDKTIRTWKVYEFKNTFELFKNYKFIQYSNTGTNFAIVYNDKIEICDLSAKIIQTFQIDAEVKSIDFSNDDSYLLTTTYDKKILIWSITGEKDKTIIQSKNILDSKIDIDDKKIIIAGTKDIQICNLEGKTLNQIFAKDSIISFNIDANRNYIYFSTLSTFYIYNYFEKMIKEIEFANIISIKVSSFNNYVLLQNFYSIVILDKNLKNIKSLYNSFSQIGFSAISKSGDFVLVTEKNKCVLLNRNGKEIYSFDLDGEIVYCDFSANEKSIIITYYDKNFIIKTKSFTISPSEIVKFTDELNLFGKIYNINEDEFDKIINN